MPLPHSRRPAPLSSRRAFPARGLATCFGLLLAAATVSASTVTVRLLDEHGNPALARLRVRNQAGQFERVMPVGPKRMLAVHPRYPELGVVVEKECRIKLAPGTFRLVADRGTEYRPVEASASSEADSTVTLKLERWIDMAARGWWSGDLHAHRRPEEMPALLAAAGLHFAPTLTRWRLQELPAPWDAPSLYFPAGTDRAYSVRNAEDERLWGAALFLNLRSPLRLFGPKEDYPPPVEMWEEARRQGAYIDLEKAIWWAAPVAAALVPPDSIGVANNHFFEEGMLDHEHVGRPRDRQRYPGQAGFAQYIFDLFALYQNAGIRTPASAGSANGVIRNPIGYNRSYVKLGPRFSAESWLEGQKSGRNFVTNGPMLFLEISGMRASLEAQSSGEIEKAELLVDGAVFRVFSPGGRRDRVRGSVKLPRSATWVAARCFEKHAGTVRFAYTSPRWLTSTPQAKPEARAAMRVWLDALLEQLPRWNLTSGQLDEWRRLCAKARMRFE